MKRARTPEADAPAVPPGMNLATATTAGEAYDRVARALDELDIPPASRVRLAIDLLKVRSTVVAAEEFRKRLELAEATAREASRQAALPARRATVDLGALPSEGGTR